MKLSRRVTALTPSATLQAKSDAEEVRRRGIDVIDFGPGEPDLDTPAPIRDAAKRALDENFTHYVETSGIGELRRGLAARFRQDYGTDYGEDEVMVGCGAKNVLYLTAQAAFEPGDRVAVYSPYWVSFPDQIRLAGAEPLILPTREEDAFVPRAAVLEEALGQGAVRAVILNSPCNPTGAVIPEDELERFVRLAREHDLLMVADETYEHFYYGTGRFASLAARSAEVRDRLILVGSFSKSYAMTGWRVGYALGPRPLIGALVKIQSHDATHTASFSMKGAVAALAAPGSTIREMRDEYRRRRDLMLSGLAGIPGVRCEAPAGAFYLFPNVRGMMERLGCPTSGDLARGLLRGPGVATVAGSAFGADGYLRFSYATSPAKIQEGMRRLQAVTSLPEAGGPR